MAALKAAAHMGRVTPGLHKEKVYPRQRLGVVCLSGRSETYLPVNRRRDGSPERIPGFPVVVLDDCGLP